MSSSLQPFSASAILWETECAFTHDTVCQPGAVLAAQPIHVSVSSALQQDALCLMLASNDTSLDQGLPAPASLLGGGTAANVFASGASAQAWSPSRLQAAAAAWALLGGLQLGPSFQPAPSLPGACTGPLDGFGVRLTTQLSTHSCGEGFFTAAHSGGIVLWEPCGGLCAGLEMVLRNGFTVSRYLYSDTDLTAQTIALHRIMQLQEQYPLQLQQQALEGCFSAMPEDITDITVQHVHAAVLSQPSAQWFVVAGWPCQDFSLAGPSRGMAAARSRLLTDLVRLIGILQQLLPEQPPGYLLENVPMQYHRNSTIAQQDFHQVTRAIGQPVVLDAAQVGSFAHRLRNFWTNLCFPEQLQAAIQFIQRPPERELSSILAVHRQPMPVARMDRAPQYVCNMPGQARQAWPTIMSRPGSYAFRSGQPGSVIDCSDPARPQETEPTAVERELAMGYAAGTTAAFGVTEAERCRTLGQCMDANALQVLFALTEAIWQSTTQPCATPHQSFVSFEPVKQNCQLLDALSESHQSLSSLEAVCNAAAAQEQATAPARGAGDVWEDPAVLQFLQTGELPRDSAPAAIRRIQRRSKHYSLVGDKLLRTMPDASQEVVPKPSERQQLVTQQHERAGHPGKRKTAALLLTRFWWYGLLADSEHLVGNCKHCSRIEADFTAKPQKLQPIPISSLAFRWHVDLAGPLPKSNRDNTFIMIAVEAFTKHLEVVPIHNKEAATVAYAFLHHVIAKFGAAGQVVTDSGTEFEGRFHDLLQDCMIDHVLISKSHPQSNGQVERMVQTVKTALKKTCAAKQRVSDWDEEVAWIAMSYRCSPQSSTGFSPYEMLYGRKPVFPPAAADVLSPEISYADPESAAKDLRIRKETIKRICPVAMENLAIAQHRDQLRYLRSRDTSYQPKTKHFRVGDFVHVQQLQRNSTLQPRAQSVIYRIKEVRETGVLLLQGKCGRTVSMHMSHCAPCHLQGISTAIDPRLTEDTDAVLCEVCGTDEQEDKLILCDICTHGYHLFCLSPALSAVPDGHWLCPDCVQQGYSVQEAQQRETEREQLAEEATAPVMFPNAAMKKRDEAAAAKHGRLVKKLFDDPLTGQLKVYWGRVHFRGALARPNYYLIMYEDGDSQTMSNRQLNPVLQEPNVTLPAGVHVPEPPAVAVATAVQQCLPSNVQHAGRFASSSVAQVPCCEIPDHDLRALSDMFVWQAWNDPITQYPGWVRLPFTLPVPNESWPQLQQRPTGVPVYLAPALPFVLQALQEAFKLKPVLIICYVPALSLPQPVWQLANVMINQGTGALLQAGKGWWLIISRRPVPSAAMRNEYDEEEILDYEDDERPAENALAPQEDEQNELPDQQGQQQEGEWPDAGPGQQQWERDVQPQSPRLVASANEPVPPSLQQPAARMRAPLASAAAAGAAGYPRNPANNAWFAYYPLLHPTWNLTYDEAARDLKPMINEKEQVHVETAGPFSTNKLRQTRRNKWSNSLRKKAVRLLAGLETGTRKAAKAALNFVPGRVPASDTDSAEAGASSPSGEESDAAAEADQEVAAVPAAATVPAAAVPAVANTSVAPAVPTSAAASAPVVTVAPTAAAEPGAVSSRPYARYVRSELQSVQLAGKRSAQAAPPAGDQKGKKRPRQTSSEEQPASQRRRSQRQEFPASTGQLIEPAAAALVPVPNPPPAAAVIKQETAVTVPATPSSAVQQKPKDRVKRPTSTLSLEAAKAEPVNARSADQAAAVLQGQQRRGASTAAAEQQGRQRRGASTAAAEQQGRQRRGTSQAAAGQQAQQRRGASPAAGEQQGRQRRGAGQQHGMAWEQQRPAPPPAAPPNPSSSSEVTADTTDSDGIVQLSGSAQLRRDFAHVLSPFLQRFQIDLIRKYQDKGGLRWRRKYDKRGVTKRKLWASLRFSESEREDLLQQNEQLKRDLRAANDRLCQLSGPEQPATAAEPPYRASGSVFARMGSQNAGPRQSGGPGQSGGSGNQQDQQQRSSSRSHATAAGDQRGSRTGSAAGRDQPSWGGSQQHAQGPPARSLHAPPRGQGRGQFPGGSHPQYDQSFLPAPGHYPAQQQQQLYQAPFPSMGQPVYGQQPQPLCPMDLQPAHADMLQYQGQPPPQPIYPPMGHPGPYEAARRHSAGSPYHHGPSPDPPDPGHRHHYG
eukprot:gene3516-biopygen5211